MIPRRSTLPTLKSTTEELRQLARYMENRGIIRWPEQRCQQRPEALPVNRGRSSPTADGQRCRSHGVPVSVLRLVLPRTRCSHRSQCVSQPCLQAIERHAVLGPDQRLDGSLTPRTLQPAAKKPCQRGIISEPRRYLSPVAIHWQPHSGFDLISDFLKAEPYVKRLSQQARISPPGSGEPCGFIRHATRARRSPTGPGPQVGESLVSRTTLSSRLRLRTGHLEPQSGLASPSIDLDVASPLARAPLTLLAMAKRSIRSGTHDIFPARLLGLDLCDREQYRGQPESGGASG